MKAYSTEQRKQLLTFLEFHKDRQFSIEEIADFLCDSCNISISAIYRNMNKLVEEGLVVRHAKEGSRKFLFQYVGNRDCSEHLHLKCTSCGQIFHMDDTSMELIFLTAMKNHFIVDKRKTILYGSCDCCR